MFLNGILNPALLSLLARFRHTNTLVIADRGFPFWPEVETVDISLIDDVPKVPQVLSAILSSCKVGAAFMAEEFLADQSAGGKEVSAEYRKILASVSIQFEPHTEFKRRVPSAIGLIRTGDSTQYANIILQSA